MKIAVFRALFLGDLLVAIPALRSLRAGFPRAEITFIGLPWAEQFIARYGDYVDRFLPFPGFPGINEVPVVPGRTERFLAEQRAYGYDLAVAMHGRGDTSNPFVAALGAKRVAAFYAETPPPGVDTGAPYPEHLSEIERNLALTALLGCPDTGRDLEFPIFPADEAEADLLLAPLGARRPLAGIHTGASWPLRRWPPEYFAQVGDYLAEWYGSEIVLTGGDLERDAALAVEHAMRIEALSLVGKTSLGGLAAVLRRLDLFISNDTGPAHLAVATGTPSVTIFGPAEYHRWAHLDRDRHPVITHPDLAHAAVDETYMRAIAPGRVMAAADGLLSGVMAWSA